MPPCRVRRRQASCANAARGPHRVATPANDRADRCPQPLAETDLRGVGAPRERVQAAAERRSGVPEPRSIEVDEKACRARRLNEGGVGVGRRDRTAGRVVGVLEAEELGAQRKVGARATRCLRHLSGRWTTWAAVPGQRLRHAAREPGRCAELALEHAAPAGAKNRSPRSRCNISAMRLPIEPEGTQSAASRPRSSATRASRRARVGS